MNIIKRKEGWQCLYLIRLLWGVQGENVYKELTITSSPYGTMNKVNWEGATYKNDSIGDVYGFSVSEIPENVKQIIIIQKQGTGSSSETGNVIVYCDVENKTVHTIKNANKQYNDSYTQDCAFFI